MSAGPFTEGFYEDDAGNIHPIRYQAETAALTLGGTTNAAPAGPADDPEIVRVSGSRRSYGFFARTVTIQWTGAAPDGYQAGGNITLPVLTPAAFASYTRNDTGTYLGANIRYVGKRSEKSGR